MPETVFAYPGGKTYLADWIISHFPDHDCYVEMFGGGASVLVNKQPSFNEIYNDQDGDLVHFFQVLRERADELEEWLEQVPYSREQHQQFKRAFYDGERADDDIERAGRFFYLRYSQFSGKYRTPSGFSSGHLRSVAKKFRNGCEELGKFQQRFRGVTIENMDYADLIDLYDSPTTFFYCDPPYVKEGDALYSHGEFDHSRFCAEILDIEGRFAVSYLDIPDPLREGVYIRSRDAAQHMNKGHEERRESAEEKLVMNYDPDQTPSFSSPEQATLVEASQ